MFKRLCVVMMIFLLLPIPSFAQDAVPYKDLDEYMTRRFYVRKIVGGAVVISYQGNVVYRFQYGRKSGSKADAATTDTCYRIASTTKMVSAIGLMQLYDQGKLQLDAPADDYLPFPVRNPYYPDDAVTPRQILSHTSSIAGGNYYKFSWEKIKPGSKYFLKKVRPGTVYQYANVNGGLIGSSIEALTGESVDTYMQKNLFGPMGIHAAYNLNWLPDQQNVGCTFSKAGKIALTPKAYLKDGAKYEDVADPRGHLALTVGNLFISAEDLNKIVRMLLNNGAYEGKQILAQSTVHLMEQDQEKIENSSVLTAGKYGLGLSRITDLPGGTWYGHQGMIHGLTSDAFYQRETGLAVTVIGNGYNAQNKDGVVTLAREMMTLATAYALDGTWDGVLSSAAQ